MSRVYTWILDHYVLANDGGVHVSDVTGR